MSPNSVQKNTGGLRTKGYFKKPQPEKPLISVITVVFNDEKCLENTILSIINQTYENVEYIIIDGGSTDGTANIIKKYEEQIDYWISETDSGIYDAMNKGIDLAAGEWVNFMNSGDSFYNDDVIKRIFSNRNNNNNDLIFGYHAVLYEPGFTIICEAGAIEKIWQGMITSHQSFFTRTTIMQDEKFNITNKIGADFEFIYSTYLKGKTFINCNQIIACTSAGGLSDVNRLESILSHWQVVNKYNKNKLYTLYYVMKIIDTYFRYFMKICLPDRIINYIRKFK